MPHKNEQPLWKTRLNALRQSHVKDIYVQFYHKVANELEEQMVGIEGDGAEEDEDEV